MVKHQQNLVQEKSNASIYPNFFICAGLISLCACSPIKVPNVATYSLTTLQASAQTKNSHSGSTLGVGVPSASPGYEGTDMIYMLTPYELSSFALHRWVAPPAQMILPLVVQALRAKGYFKAVVSTPYSVQTNYRLDFQVLKLQQNFLLPVSREEVVIQVNFFNNRTNQVIASRRFSATVAAGNNTPYSGVLAANQAVARLSQQIASFAVRAVK